VWSSEVVETFPFIQFSLEVDITLVTQELIELLLIGSVGSLHLTIELRGAPFDVGVPDLEIFDMPMEFGLEFVAIIRTDFTNVEWELFDDVVNEARWKRGPCRSCRAGRFLCKYRAYQWPLLLPPPLFV
jgi:hypothetical protein